MQRFISIDFETRSIVDLRSTGVYPYAEDPSTEILCMAYALGEDEPALWVPGDPVPSEVTYAIENGYDFRAWNAQFERVIWRDTGPRYGLPEVPFERWVCSAAEAAAMALPRHLAGCGRVLGTKHQKDDAGHRLMLQMCKPRRPRKGEDPDGLYWHEDADRLNRLYKYCLQDVETERDIAKRLRRLSDREREVYLLDQTINDRGVLIDYELVRALKRLAEEAIERANLRLFDLTNGTVEAVTNVQNIRKWLERVGVPLPDLTKQTVAEALQGELPSVAREVLLIRQDNGKTSAAKLDSMLSMLCADGRARGMLLYHGAGTGRWSGMGIQPQNFPRGNVKNPERLIPLVLAGNYDELEEEAPIMEIVSSLLRACFVATPGSRFVGGDFSAIEGHVTAWLAEQDSMTSYEEMAGAIFDMDPGDVEPGSFERHVGKTAVLGCGFGMGWEKFKTTVKDWTGFVIDDDTAVKAVDAYRLTNYRIKRLWYALESAAMRAVQKPGIIQTAGRNECIRFKVKGDFLWCGLPSGRLLCYALPRIEDRLTPWGDMKACVTFSGTNSMTKKWERRSLYGGLITENVVQATARDLMAESMLRLEQEGYPVVLTVHDEILAEMPDGIYATSFDIVMARTPEWGQQIPVKVEDWEGERFRK